MKKLLIIFFMSFVIAPVLSATDIEKCKTDIQFEYIGKLKQQPEYQRIYSELDAISKKNMEQALDTPYGYDGNGNCNTYTYTFTASDTPRKIVPENCWRLAYYHPSALENQLEAEKRFYELKCNQAQQKSSAQSDVYSCGIASSASAPNIVPADNCIPQDILRDYRVIKGTVVKAKTDSREKVELVSIRFTPKDKSQSKELMFIASPHFAFYIKKGIDGDISFTADGYQTLILHPRDFDETMGRYVEMVPQSAAPTTTAHAVESPTTPTSTPEANKAATSTTRTRASTRSGSTPPTNGGSATTATVHKKINGTIIEGDTKLPAIGAYVTPRGVKSSPSNSGIADETGAFHIEMFPANTDAEVSYMGYTTRIVSASQMNDGMNITLQPSTETLDKAVLSIVDCGKEKRAELHALTAEVLNNTTCIPTSCENGYILEKPKNIDAKCTSCTGRVPLARTVTVENNQCVPDRCETNLVRVGNQCLVDCDKFKSKLNAKTVTRKTPGPTTIAANNDYSSFCNIESCINNSFKKINNQCVLQTDKECDVAKNIKYASPKGKYIYDRKTDTLICIPDSCTATGYVVNKTTGQCELKDNNCPAEILEKMDPNASAGSIKERDPITGVAKTCEITGCNNSMTPNSNGTKCVNSQCGCGQTWDSTKDECVSKTERTCSVKNVKHAKPSGKLQCQNTTSMALSDTCDKNTSCKEICAVTDCEDDYKLNQQNNSCDVPTGECDFTGDKQFAKDKGIWKEKSGVLVCEPICNGTNYELDWNPQEKKYNGCKVKYCPCGSILDDSTKSCKTWAALGKSNCDPMPTGATAATRSCRDNSSGAETTNCAEGTCTEFCKITACDTAAGYILKDGTCESQAGKPCTAEQLPENAVAGTQRENNGKIECVISKCARGFEVRPDELSCAPKMVLSPEQYQDEIAELADNAQKMHERETSLENRILGAAGIGATGIGGTMIGGALAERRADDEAERAMRAYLETFRCDYGNGTNVKGGETNVELPGGNDMIGLYTEYAQLANDLKIRKEALGLRPGIESEVVIDKAETGLYEYSNNGITGGTYASIARALLNPDGEDAKMWAAQRAATDSKLKTGAIVAGVGTVGSLVGNIAINHGKGNNAKEIIARYEKLRAPLAVAAEHANTPYTPGDNSLDCSRFTGTTGVGKSPNCVCADPTNTRFNYDRGGCVPCESNKVYNQNDECVCPSATPRWNDAKNSCESEPTVCLLANKLKHATKCECVENASAPDGKNCHCKTDEGFEEKDGQCVQKEVPPEHESGSEIGKFSFSADALFASSRWEIKSDKLTQLRSDLANAKQTATTEKIDLNADDYCVVVVGKTDRTQYPKNSSMNNTKLSLYRANAIKNELKTVFKESNILTYGIAAKDCPKSKYPKANTADCRRVDVTWLAGSCEDNKNNTTNWISNVAEATDAISELQSLLKK